MPLKTPTYSDYGVSLGDRSDQQILMNSSGHGHSDSCYYSGDAMPMHHISSSGTEVSITPAKKRVGAIDVINPMEQETLLDPGPVRLAPCWESRHAPTEELNFKTPKPDYDEKPPKDRWNFVFMIFILHGIGILMPWNMFITAKTYFVDFKLNVTNSETPTEYQKNFLPYLGVASQVPNVLCNALNVFVQFSGGSLTFRILGSIFVEICIFLITAILAMIDSSSWPGVFFYVTMVSVVINNMANGVYQNSLYGLAAKLPDKYSMAIVLGSNTSGTLTSLILIISLAASPNIRTAAIYYFLTALLILLACADTYYSLPLFKFFKHHQILADRAAAESQTRSRRPPYWEIFCKIWPQCLNVFMVFFVTLTIFPAFLASIQRVDKNFPLPELYFTPVTCFLCFNFSAMMGSVVPNWIKWPGRRLLCIPIFMRLAFIPLFMICNYNPDTRNIPVYINNDWVFATLTVLFGFTSGYYSSLAMMAAPQYVSTQHAPVAGMMAAMFLVIGIMCGVNFTFFVTWVVETKFF